jgi:hypothetical protein
MVVFDKGNHHIGERVMVTITDSTSATLLGEEPTPNPSRREGSVKS